MRGFSIDDVKYCKKKAYFGAGAALEILGSARAANTQRREESMIVLEI